MQIVIPSKGRATVLREKALRLFPDAAICVGDDEVDAYSRISQIRYLKRKWGPYLDVVQAKGTTRLVVRVQR